uniref:C3H1-type domain-containing protein n=1 Tax=Alexandrium monilatum TaxID=311494 RepID=A0A7S4SBF7_9DINO
MAQGPGSALRWWVHGAARMAADAHRGERKRSEDGGYPGQSATKVNGDRPAESADRGDRADRAGRAGDRADRGPERSERVGGSVWHHPRNGSLPSADKSIPLAVAMQSVSDAGEPDEWVLRCAGAALENPSAGRGEAEAVLTKLSTWLAPPASPQVLSQIASSGIPVAVVRAIRKYRSEPPAAALACVVVVRSSGTAESTSAHIRAGALEEVSGLMDRHPSHGGVQNVCLILMDRLLKDSSTARQAVSSGAVSRVVRAMEATPGREVQYNGLAALRVLADIGRAPRSGLQEVAMRAKAAHSSDAALCNMANDVLALVAPRFKEVLCWHWQSGWCKLGPRCTYAHGPSDMRGA